MVSHRAASSPPSLIDELLHELRSPLSLLLIRAEADGDEALERLVLRMECLLRYAAAAVAARPVDSGPVPLAASVAAAADALLGSWSNVHVADVAVPAGMTVLLPVDEETRLTLLCAWLETAAYGAEVPDVAVEASPIGREVLVEARASAAGSRGLANVRARLSTRAAAQLAGAIGGRLIVSGSLAHAALVLPLAATSAGSLAQTDAA